MIDTNQEYKAVEDIDVSLRQHIGQAAKKETNLRRSFSGVAACPICPEGHE